jgi:hypothetical protein
LLKITQTQEKDAQVRAVPGDFIGDGKTIRDFKKIAS